MSNTIQSFLAQSLPAKATSMDAEKAEKSAANALLGPFPNEALFQKERATSEDASRQYQFDEISENEKLMLSLNELNGGENKKHGEDFHFDKSAHADLDGVIAGEAYAVWVSSSYNQKKVNMYDSQGGKAIDKLYTSVHKNFVKLTLLASLLTIVVIVLNS